MFVEKPGEQARGDDLVELDIFILCVKILMAHHSFLIGYRNRGVIVAALEMCGMSSPNDLHVLHVII